MDGDVAAVSGCLMLVAREVFERVGLFDERYFFGFEDIDFCLRARAAGFRTRVAAGAVAYHQGGAAIGARVASSSVLRGAESPDAGARTRRWRRTDDTSGSRRIHHEPESCVRGEGARRFTACPRWALRSAASGTISEAGTALTRSIRELI